MRRFSALLSMLLIAGSLSGCVYTRLTEMTWEAGRLHYYADFSRIVNDCVYELSGRYYMTVCINAYSDSPEFLGLLAPAVSFRNSSLNTEKFRPKPPFTRLQITPELAKYLTDAGNGNGKIPYIADHVIRSGVGENFSKQGKPLPVIRELPAPEIMPVAGTADSISDSVPVYRERTFAGFCAQLALPFSFLLDAAMTPVVNAAAYFYALPGAALTAFGARLMAQDGVDLGETEMVFSCDDEEMKGNDMDKKIAPAGEYEPIPLYSVTKFDETGNDERAKNVTVQYFVPEKRSGAAVIVCPGGGYGCLCDSYEGYEVARWLNRFGITAIVLRYRVGKNLDLAPLTDALTAVRYVRENAGLYGIDHDRIGIIGFSAGGHLASAAATHGKEGSAVNFHILIYPVISFDDKWTHKGSQQNFLGKFLNDENKKKYSGELQVTGETSPAFICHAVTDQTVPVENSRMYADAMKKHKVPVTYLELPKGAHGLGCGSGSDWKAWQEACEKWLLENKLGSISK